MSVLVVRGATALVQRWDLPPVRDGWVAIEDGRITAIGTKAPPRGDRQLDADHCLILPGLVNPHHHLFQGASRGIATDGGLVGWLRTHYRAWAQMTSADVAAAARLSLAQLALGGCSTVAAFEYLHPRGEDFVTPIVDAAREIGLRLLYVRGCAPRLEARLADSLAAEGVAVNRLLEPEEDALAGTRAVVNRATSDMLRWACGPTTPVVDDGGAFQRALTEIADEAQVGIHTHFHPLPGPDRDHEAAAEMAERLGLLRRGNWFAHGSRLTPDDVGRLGHAGVGIVHCPSCSIALGYAIPDLGAWRARNDRTSIAVDGAASNDRGSLLLELQLAWQLQRVRVGNGVGVRPHEMLDLATTAAARAIGWPGLGSLEVGGPADFLVLRLDTVELAGAADDPRAVLFRLFRTYAGQPVRDLFVGGRQVVSDGRLTGLREDEVVDRADAVAQRLYPTMGG